MTAARKQPVRRNGTSRNRRPAAVTWVEDDLVPTELREFKPDVVLAFPGGTGTADCVKQARAMKIPVLDALTGEVLP